MGTPRKILSPVYDFAGKCPGGEYGDSQGKLLPCPRKEYQLPADHPFIQEDLRSGREPKIKCTRCGSEIVLKPVERMEKDPTETPYRGKMRPVIRATIVPGD